MVVAGEPASGQDTEVEWQFDALDLRPVERWADEHAAPVGDGAAFPPRLQLAPQPIRQLVDRYADTEDWRIGRSGHVLRLRQRRGTLEATLKDRSPARAGLRQRLELTQVAHGAGLQALGSLDPSGPVGSRLRSLAGARRLAEVLEVRTRRRPFTLLIDGEPAGELALDDTMIRLPGHQRRLHLQRVEVEVSPAVVKSMRPVVQQMSRECGLAPATLSKFEAGLLAAGLAIPPSPDLGPTTITRQSTTGEVAYAVLRRDTAALLAYEPGTRLGEDIEALHQMRVSTRRLRAALDLFAPALPARAMRFRAELGWLAGTLGVVRDLDIQLTHCESWIAASPDGDRSSLLEVERLLEQRRASARADLIAALDSRRYERLIAGMSSMLQAGPLRRSTVGRQVAVVTMAPWIEDRHNTALRAARRARKTGVAADFHRLRIKCKRLRYSLEFASELYGSELRGFSKLLARLQDQLGLMQDAEVAEQRLRELCVSEDASALDPSTIFVMGAVAERYRVERDERLAALPGALRDLSGPRSKRAFSAMDRQRERTVAALVAERAASLHEPEPIVDEVAGIEEIHPGVRAQPRAPLVGAS